MCGGPYELFIKCCHTRSGVLVGCIAVYLQHLMDYTMIKRCKVDVHL